MFRFDCVVDIGSDSAGRGSGFAEICYSADG